ADHGWSWTRSSTLVPRRRRCAGCPGNRGGRCCAPAGRCGRYQFCRRIHTILSRWGSSPPLPGCHRSAPRSPPRTVRSPGRRAPRCACSGSTRTRCMVFSPRWRPSATGSPGWPPPARLGRWTTCPRPARRCSTSPPRFTRPGRCVSLPHERALRIGIGGPVGSGKTALVAALCRALAGTLQLAVVTNDIYTTEDADSLLRNGVLPAERIRAVETGCCPHTAIRDDISANLDAVEGLEARLGQLDLILVESGGDNLTATFSRGLVDRQIFVVDVAGGDKVPRKGGPGVTSADLLVINKTDLAPLVGADLGVMARDAAARRRRRAPPFPAPC